MCVCCAALTSLLRSLSLSLSISFFIDVADRLTLPPAPMLARNTRKSGTWQRTSPTPFQAARARDNFANRARYAIDRARRLITVTSSRVSKSR